MYRVGYLVTFALGAAVGSVASWMLLKKKYERIAQEEIDSVKEMYGNKVVADVVPKDDLDDDFTEEEKQEYSDILEDYENGMNKREKGGSDRMSIGTDPYVISPDEFGEIEEYETDYLTYYNDGVLTDNRDIPIDDVDAVVGLESLERMGEYEDDILHVRNERLRIDYEICMDSRDYSELMAGDLNLKGE